MLLREDDFSVVDGRVTWGDKAHDLTDVLGATGGSGAAYRKAILFAVTVAAGSRHMLSAVGALRPPRRSPSEPHPAWRKTAVEQRPARAARAACRPYAPPLSR